MTTFPGSPRLLEGVIAGVDLLHPLASVNSFQYNSDALTSTLRQVAQSRWGR